MGEATPSALGSEPAGLRAFTQVAEKVAGLALRFLGGHHARVYQADGDTFRRVAAAGPDGSVAADIAWSRVLSGADSARATSDILAESECRLEAPTRRMIKARRLGALAGAAVHVRGTVVGSLVLADRTGRRFTDQELALLASLADQAGAVGESSQLEAELSRQRYEAGELALVAGLIGQSLDHVAVAQRIAEAVLGLLGVHSSAIRLFR
ncbi:MAG TPA: GAF domain-containing protein, partial [Methylomirabilota bacterium]|nr:GAF domain-containing protein [Methylomirabilota bacterium]